MKGSGQWAAGVTFAVLAVAVSSLVAVSSQPTTPQAPPPTFRTEANYVRVDVFPTHDGAPVLDLKQDDFEVIEGNAPQKIEQFEHITLRAVTPQDTRIEPNTVRESLAMVQNSRARVFVIFLDIAHVDVESSHRIRLPLVKALDQLIGPEDLVAVMTPDMSPRDLTLARKTATIEGFLASHWNWGERDSYNPKDPKEEQYQRCYPGLPHTDCPDGTTYDDRGVADQMIARRREKMTIDALGNLVTYLRGVREERKAVLAISDGWLLFTPNSGLNRMLNCQIPGLPTAGYDPRTGRLGTNPQRDPLNGDTQSCERDRMLLAGIDDEKDFRELLDQANRANTSFYPIDPRGLAVFDTSIAAPRTGLPPDGTSTIVSPSSDQAMLRNRVNTLRTLAEATDGLAIVNSNDLDKGFKRIVDDLSSYYLLGYYSTGKLDGKFHSITVRVKRPGVRVRARRGYLAATPAEVSLSARGSGSGGAAKPVDTPAAAAAAAATRAAEAAVAPLSGFARDVPLRVQVTAGWKPDDVASATMWVVGELGSAAVAGAEWNEGFDVTATLITSSDVSAATGHLTVSRNVRTFRIALVASRPLAAGDYTLNVSARGGSSSIPARDTMRLTIPNAPASVGALFLRRGISTGNKDTPTADLRFRRNEQIHVEMPAVSADPVTARLLDRTGHPLAVPVAAAVRDDGDGSRWRTAGLALAPLAPGDYVIELSSGTERMLAAFRVVP